jgi:hypothetical protein
MVVVHSQRLWRCVDGMFADDSRILEPLISIQPADRRKPRSLLSKYSIVELYLVLTLMFGRSGADDHSYYASLRHVFGHMPKPRSFRWSLAFYLEFSPASKGSEALVVLPNTFDPPLASVIASCLTQISLWSIRDQPCHILLSFVVLSLKKSFVPSSRFEVEVELIIHASRY